MLEDKFNRNLKELWAVRRKLVSLSFARNLTEHEREYLMSALEDMTTAVSNLEAAATTAISEIATLKSADNETALAALASRVNQVTTNLTAAVPAPTPPAAG